MDAPPEKTDLAPPLWRRFAKLIERAAALAIAFVLLKSSLAHLANPYQFLSAIYSYELVGPSTGPWIAALVPFVQLTIAMFLLLRFFALEAYLLGIALFIGFIYVQTSAIRRGLNIECGCFGGIGGDVVGPKTLAIAQYGLAACICGSKPTITSRCYRSVTAPACSSTRTRHGSI